MKIALHITLPPTERLCIILALFPNCKASSYRAGLDVWFGVPYIGFAGLCLIGWVFFVRFVGKVCLVKIAGLSLSDFVCRIVLLGRA